MLKYIKSLLEEDYFIRVVGFLISIFLFWMFDYIFKFNLEYLHYFIFIIICTFGILLSPFYYSFKNYDKILHFLSPFLLSILIFFVVDNLREILFIKLFITFSITVLFITLFEIGEYSLDKFLGWHLQGVYRRDYSGTVKLEMLQNRIDDTMQDLIFGVAGSIFFVLIKLII